jgi:ribosomal-protein-alanine N-acetyltransferase
MSAADFPFVVEPMHLDDIPQVMTIERGSFPLPWPERAYHYELSQNQNSHYVVLRPTSEADPEHWWHALKRVWRRNLRPQIIGYGGFWLIAGEAHISTIAIDPNWRRGGLGELLLWDMLKRAVPLEVFEATLEVRVSNQVAQNLYHKYGFEKVGRRRRYYQDNGEDAWIMTVANFDGQAYQSRLDQLGRDLQRRLQQQGLP